MGYAKLFLSLVVSLSVTAAAPQSQQGQTERQGQSGRDRTSGAQGQAGQDHTGRHGTQAMAGNTSDTEFARKAASGGLMEVELGKIAQQRGTSSQVKQIGKTLERDHSKANNELKRIASSEGITLPGQMEAEHSSHLDRLRNLSGAEFDSAFMQMQAEHHRKDISEFQQEASQGQNSRLKEFASKQLPVLQGHLRMLERGQGTASREGTPDGQSGRSTTGDDSKSSGRDDRTQTPRR